ncbi:MAG: QueT transporter family protein [Oscillospiraceae bacterium]|nr:QueT transporter family protein [Oscillospiraceae bacterium]
MKENSPRTRGIAVAAAVGAAYAVLTMALAPISYGAVQLRVSEALCILPYFIPVTAWGLYAGCFLANLITGNIFDILLGSLATLAAGLLTARIGKRARTVPNQLLACLMPVVFNAVIVGAVITGAYEGLNIFRHFGVFTVNAAWVGLGEAVVLYVIGFPLMRYLPGLKFFREFVEKTRK